MMVRGLAMVWLAELTISNIIFLARQLGDRNREMHANNWQKKSNNCYEVRGKTLGIIGYGHVGSQLGVMGEFLGMNVIWYDHQQLMPIGNSTPMRSLEELLKKADFISLNVPKIEENIGIFGAEQFALMKKGAFFINASFNKAVDLEALAAAIKSGHLGGAAIDTFPPGIGTKISDTSPIKFQSSLVGLKNVILTPNIAGETYDSQMRVGIEVANQIIRYIFEGCTQGSYNFPNIETRPVKENQKRIINIHKNVRGVMTEINAIVSDFNISKQVIDTRDNIGYAIIDVDTAQVSNDIVASLAILSNSIRSRVL